METEGKRVQDLAQSSVPALGGIIGRRISHNALGFEEYGTCSECCLPHTL